LTPLAPPRPFGTLEGSDKISVTLPSEVRLPIPANASRLMVATRKTADGEGRLEAEWMDSDRKRLKVRNSAAFPFQECWLISKEAVWDLGAVPAGISATLELKDAVPFDLWASRLLEKGHEQTQWWGYTSSWKGISPSRYGLVLSFYDALKSTWNGSRTHHQLYERGVDLSAELPGGRAILAASFSGDLTAVRCRPELSTEVFGWARCRVREAGR